MDLEYLDFPKTLMKENRFSALSFLKNLAEMDINRIHKKRKFGMTSFKVPLVKSFSDDIIDDMLFEAYMSVGRIYVHKLSTKQIKNMQKTLPKYSRLWAILDEKSLGFKVCRNHPWLNHFLFLEKVYSDLNITKSMLDYEVYRTPKAITRLKNALVKDKCENVDRLIKIMITKEKSDPKYFALINSAKAAERCKAKRIAFYLNKINTLEEIIPYDDMSSDLIMRIKDLAVLEIFNLKQKNSKKYVRELILSYKIPNNLGENFINSL